MLRVTIAAFLGGCSAFYLPGVAPREFLENEPIDLKVNKLDSVKTQLPYDYYSLPFCQPATITEANENLGEVLSGDLIESSAYNIRMMKAETCKELCRKEYKKEEMKLFSERIHEDYSVNWIIDNMPAGQQYVIVKQGADESEATTHQENIIYEKGFPLGFVNDGKAYLNNHVHITLSYHEDKESFEGYRLVGFLVDPYSVKHTVEGDFKDENSKLRTCSVSNTITSNANPQEINPEAASAQIIFTYDVKWESSPIRWASRWDLYLKMTNPSVHWFSIFNSMIIVFFLSAMVAMTLIRTLNRDLARYNAVAEALEDAEEEGGWKLIHGDVFRTPAYAGMLSTLVGTGYQILAMTFLTIGFACLGFLSPSNRGGLLTALLVLYVLMGMLAGYYGTRMYKMFGLTEWKKNTLLTALFFPGVMFGGFFILNLFVWGEKSSGAVPFGTLVALLALWLGISAPLVYLGSYMAFKRPAIEHPLRVNNIPRMLPETSRLYWPACAVVAGALPFGAIFVEIFFIMSSVWYHHFYYMFGILALVFVLLVITCAEVSILLVYLSLCGEDYNWWWLSFLTAGSTAFYVFGYSVYYFFTQLEIIKFVSGLLFFGYMGLASFAFFICTGTIGHVACYYFVRKIYGSVKID